MCGDLSPPVALRLSRLVPVKFLVITVSHFIHFLSKICQPFPLSLQDLLLFIVIFNENEDLGFFKLLFHESVYIFSPSLSQLYVKIFMPALPVSLVQIMVQSMQTSKRFSNFACSCVQAEIFVQYSNVTLIVSSFRLLLCTSCKGDIFKIRYNNETYFMAYWK